jgi:hypothetical protein
LGLTALLLESHQRLFQRPLVCSNGIRLAAQELFVLDQVVLCHDGSEDPRFLYANRAALQLFSRNWEQMVGMPSRLSASANQRLSRREQLELARRQDKLENYSGVRVNSQGRRFQIRGARIWSLIDQKRHYSGQAACFSQWWWEP